VSICVEGSGSVLKPIVRGSGRPRVGKAVYSGSSSVWNRCGNPYLPKGITKESEVADTEGSTATSLHRLHIESRETV
jgi:hypothetical protein